MTSNKRSRPSPNSILDREALVQALEDRDIVLKAQQVDGFYQALHRQHYPSLPEFVENYYRNEARSPQTDFRPLPTPMSKRKNRNPTQLNGHFLDFLKDSQNGFTTITSSVKLALQSADKTTTKLAIRLHDDHVVESVLMRYNNKSGCRASLCVSSQVGCAMGCTFCATGLMGIRGNLLHYEILEQVIHANRILAEEQVALLKENQQQVHNNNKNQKNRHKTLALVGNVVFMGMGEPLNNYDNVVAACKALLDHKRWHLATKKVTISTVGVTPRIRQLTQELPEVNLALSLHAPNQELRSKIVPAAKHYKIEALVEALDDHMKVYLMKNDSTKDEGRLLKESTKRRAMIEYVMLEGPTSTFESAHQLGKLCQNRLIIVNLIPYNQTNVKDKLRCPSEEHMSQFQDIVSSYKVVCTIRRTMGADIGSACGQLIQMEETKKKVVDIEDAAGGDSIIKTAAVSGSRRTKQTEVDDDENNMDRFVFPLAVATGIAATCFVVVATIFMRQRRRE